MSLWHSWKAQVGDVCDVAQVTLNPITLIVHYSRLFQPCSTTTIMLYRVAGDPKIGYDLGVGTGTYGGYVPWYGYGTLVRVRYGGTVRGYGTGVWYGSTVRGYGTGYGTGVRYGGYSTGVRYCGYGTGVRRTGTVYPSYLFSRNVLEIAPYFLKTGTGYTVPVRRTPVPFWK